MKNDFCWKEPMTECTVRLKANSSRVLRKYLTALDYESYNDPGILLRTCKDIQSKLIYFHLADDDKMKYNYSHNYQKKNGWSENTKLHILHKGESRE